MTLIERLQLGLIEHRRRWSGDTHDDLGGSVDYEATEALMREAAAEIERLEGEVRAANEAIEEAAKWAASIAAGLAKPAPTGFLGEP